MKPRKILSLVLSLALMVTLSSFTPQTATAGTYGSDTTGNYWTEDGGTTKYYFANEPGIMNFSRTGQNQVLIADMALSSENTMTVTKQANGNWVFKGFEGGGGLESTAADINQIHTGCEGLITKCDDASILNYSTATADQKSVMDGWNCKTVLRVKSKLNNYASGTYYYGTDINLYITGTSSSTDTIDVSRMSHMYVQYWINANQPRGRQGELMFNLVCTDNTMSGGNAATQDGWNWSVDLSKIKCDDTGTVLTGHTQQQSMVNCGTNGTNGSLSKAYRLSIRYRVQASKLTDAEKTSVENGTWVGPTFFFGTIFMRNPLDNQQPGFHYLNGSNYYGEENIPDPNQVGILRVSGSPSAKAHHSLIGCTTDIDLYIPFLPINSDIQNTFIVGMRYGDYGWSNLEYAAWRWNATGTTFTGNTVVSGNGGAFSTRMNRTNSKYLSASSHTRKTYS